MSAETRYWLFVQYSGWKEVGPQEYLKWQKSDRFGCYWKEPHDFGSEGVAGRITQGEITLEKYPNHRALVEVASQTPPPLAVCENHQVEYNLLSGRCHHCHTDSGAM